MSSAKKKIKYKKKPRKDIFMKNILTRKIILPFQSVGSNIKENIIKILEQESYNKCSKEGYIKNNSINIISYSSGLVVSNDVMFDVLFECLLCHPVEGQIIKCKVLNITRAGLRATYAKEEVSPITVFIARDHHFKNEYFAKIKEEEEINIKVIGIRYELHDKTISVLGELKIPKKSKMKTKVIIE